MKPEDFEERDFKAGEKCPHCGGTTQFIAELILPEAKIREVISEAMKTLECQFALVAEDCWAWMNGAPCILAEQWEQLTAGECQEFKRLYEQYHNEIESLLRRVTG